MESADYVSNLHFFFLSFFLVTNRIPISLGPIIYTAKRTNVLISITARMAM